MLNLTELIGFGAFTETAPSGWQFIGAGSVATGASPTVPLPSSWAQNDLLVIVAHAAGNVQTTLSGWSVAVANLGGTSCRMSVFYKVAGASESSVALGGSTQSSTRATMLAYRGINTLAPLDVVGTMANSNGSSLTTNSLTTTTANDLVISVFGTKSSGTGTLTMDANLDERVNVGSTSTLSGLAIGDELKVSAGATTARTTTWSLSNTWAAIAVSFKPA